MFKHSYIPYKNISFSKIIKGFLKIIFQLVKPTCPLGFYELKTKRLDKICACPGNPDY